MRLVVHVNAAVCEMLVLHYYYLYLFGAIYHGKQSIFFPGGKYNIAVISGSFQKVTSPPPLPISDTPVLTPLVPIHFVHA